MQTRKQGRMDAAQLRMPPRNERAHVAYAMLSNSEIPDFRPHRTSHAEDCQL